MSTLPMRWLALVVLSLCLVTPVLTGCTSSALTTDAAGKRIMYPITEAEADQVLSQSMLAIFPEGPIATVALPNKGYTATIRFLIDSHQITATSVPAIGRAADGTQVRGYSFDVTHAGTIPITGGARAAKLMETINQRASALRPALPVN